MNENMVTIVTKKANLSHLEEMFVVAVLRELAPHESVAIVFSKVAAQIAAYTGQRYVDLVGEKPSEFSARYCGTALSFSRDNCTPPLLWVKRNVGPWAPIPPASPEIARWASQKAPLEFADVDFAEAVRNLRCDSDALMIAWLRAHGDYRRSASTSESASTTQNVSEGSTYMARVIRRAHKADGLVCELTTPAAAGATGFLPSAAMPLGTDIDALLGREITVKVVGKKAGSVLLNRVADRQQLSLQSIPNVLKALEQIKDDACGGMAVLRSFADCDDATTALPMADGVLRRALAQICRHALEAWVGRGGLQTAKVPSSIPGELLVATDDLVPYAQVAAAIAAL